MWREGRVWREYFALTRDPVFYGRGFPRGSGQPVLLIPGFMAGDITLNVMSDWLQRLGYAPQPAGIRVNIHNSELLLAGLRRRLLNHYLPTRSRVTLIGHSRGGLLAKVLADRHPQLVERVIALGSPLTNPFDIHPLTMASVQAARLINFLRHPLTVEERFLGDLAAAPAVPTTSIYTRSDGVVNWRACVRPDVTCVEVDGCHIGLAVNREVYRVLARLLPGRF
jgi:pimeloyl-ACP methyl ester carboxylesterase